jgi:hypothetical protein
MPDIYIKRSGIDMQEVDNKMEGTELEELKSKLSKQEYEDKLKTEEMEYMKSQIKEINKIVEMIKKGKK